LGKAFLKYFTILNFSRTETSFHSLLSIEALNRAHYYQERGYMFFKKNLPNAERGIRLVLGLGLVFLGLNTFHASLLGYAIAISGLIAAATGFIGFCPMCAMVGRKLDKRL
jgi:Protein of unknown function (DUF2892)